MMGTQLYSKPPKQQMGHILIFQNNKKLFFKKLQKLSKATICHANSCSNSQVHWSNLLEIMQ